MLLAVVALFGLGVPFVASGVAAAHAAALGGPNPDPPPPPPPPPAPPPPPPPVVPPPPPPPPPPPAYVPPPPPPPAYTPPTTSVHKAKPKPKPKPHRAKKKDAAVAPVTSTFTPRGPDGPVAPAVLAVVPSSQSVGSGSSDLLRLLLVAGLVLSVLLVGMAATPPWALPRHMGPLVYDHRDALLTGGLVTAAGIAVGLAITLLGS